MRAADAPAEGCGLIYCATRENTELVAGYLKSVGISATAYHGGFPPDRKQGFCSVNFWSIKFKCCGNECPGYGYRQAQSALYHPFRCAGIDYGVLPGGRTVRQGRAPHRVFCSMTRRISGCSVFYRIESARRRKILPKSFISPAGGDAAHVDADQAADRDAPTRVLVIAAELWSRAG